MKVRGDCPEVASQLRIKERETRGGRAELEDEASRNLTRTPRPRSLSRA